ncbi:MAG: ABC transporter ATP-binding protein [Planctomycetota bacterium]|jgi:ABC-2 type transport system ATP-binding protein
MEPIITIEGLTKNYGSKQVLCGIDLSIDPGRILGYIGPNGAGKTTTVKIMIGMIPEFSGQVKVCGFDVATSSLEVKRRIGYIPESAAMYDSLTPLEYLRFIGRIYGLGDTEIDGRARDMLACFELDGQVDERMSTFSKGMRQKVLIIAGLIHDPEVIFMDEPLSGLDANTAVIVKEIISQLAQQGKTIFYCSHVMDVVERVCDRIVIISEGRIIADGSFEQLQSMNKEASLERIFTQLTSEGGHGAVAENFIGTFQKQRGRS